jgi:hypothetical protein
VSVLEKEFEEELIQMAEQQRLVCGWNPTRFLQTVAKQGGVKTVKGMLAKRQQSEAFDRLAEQNRLDLSQEALVVKGKYAALFTDDEVNACFDMLCSFGYYG